MSIEHEIVLSITLVDIAEGIAQSYLQSGSASDIEADARKIPDEILEEAKAWVEKDFNYEFVFEQISSILNYRMGDKLEKLRGCTAMPPWKEKA